jgi:hypothetical protein
MPRGRDTTVKSLDAGLRDITNPRGYDRWGFPKEHPPPCRFCGNRKTYWVQETNWTFIYGCPTENCPNNQDAKTHEYMIANRSKKRPIGAIREDQFGEVETF